MAPKEIYQDDGALTKFLDNLIDSANEPPTSAQPISTEFSATNLNISVTPDRLPHAISLANDLLREGRQCPPLPLLADDNANADQVLAAAVSAILRLSRCCKANVGLRVDAEHRTRTALAEVDRLSRVVQVSKDQLQAKESANVGLKNKLAELEMKNKRKLRQLATDNNNLKARLAAADGHINQLKLEAKKRERQYTQLQQRVHALMSASKKLSIEPAITRGEGNKLKFHRKRSIDEDSEDDNASSDDELDMGPAAVLLEENNAFRQFLHSIQLEMDDIIAGYRSAFQFLYPTKEQTAGASDVSDTEEDVNSSIPAPALSVERMHLPYQMIRDDVEGQIDEKFSVIRKALAQADQR